MKAALLPDRGVVKVAGADARTFLNGLLTTDVTKLTPEQARFGALLTPQGKIIVDCIVAEAPAGDGGGFFLDCPRALAPHLVEKLNFYKLRAKAICEDLSEVLGVMAIWDGGARFQAEWEPVSRPESAPSKESGARSDAKPVPTFAERAPTTEYGLVYADPRLPALGQRVMLPLHLAKEAATDLGAELMEAAAYEAHRIALGVPRGGLDFIYGDAFPHETDMDQLAGVDFDKGCYVGQEVVSRMEHRGTARNRIVPVTAGNFAPDAGVPVMAGDRQVGTTGSHAGNRGLAMLRLDRVADARAAGIPLTAGGVVIEPGKPAWATFDWPGET
jgi:tRNA-modifying protein YgfZ